MGAARTAAVMESRMARMVKRMIICCCSKDQPRWGIPDS
jgi:hypothetical protein